MAWVFNHENRIPEKWVADCKSVGNGEKALVCVFRGIVTGDFAEA
jgi:hypothetical protein